MKFAVFLLLGVCAFAANASQNVFTPHEFQLATNRGVLETIQEFIEKLVKKSQEAVEGLLKAATEIFNKFTDELQNILVSALNKISEIILKVEEKLEELSEQGEHFKECVDKYRPELDQVFTKAEEDIQECLNNAGDHFKHIPDSIQVQVDAINEQIEQLRNVVHECFEPSKPVSSVKCAIEKGNEIAKSIGGIISNAYRALENATKESVNIVAEANECVQNTVNEAQQKSDDILEKIDMCIESQKLILINY